ncbi:hypothetical protein ANCDUO_18669, partial [Ancylostoma duodenale]
LQEIKIFRTNLALLCNFDWVPIPIAYPQIYYISHLHAKARKDPQAKFNVVLTTQCIYYISHLHAKARKDPQAKFNVVLTTQCSIQIDLYVPFMTILQFIFFFGWMKVAEALLNPLGEDDDDFECNFLIDKNIATGLSIVDETYDYCPELKPDRFMDPNYEPVYSEESQKHGHDNALVGSAEGIKWVLCRISLLFMDDSSEILHNSQFRTTTSVPHV